VPETPTTGGATAASPAATVAAPVATAGTAGGTSAATARATQAAGGTAVATGPAVTVAYDAYAPYYPVRIAQQQGLAQQYGITLRPVPFGLGGENDFNEEQRRQALKDGRFDVLLTTLDAVALFPDEATGKVVAIIDESAGADKIVARQPVARLNDLRGKRITYSAGSVAEYFLYANLSLVGLGPGDVTLVPQDDIEKAVAAFKANQADALVGWEPNIGEALEDPNVKVVIGSDNFRAILDVIVVSDKALREKPDAIQGFLNAWFAAVKLTTDDPQRAGQAVVQSGENNWTGISKPEDLADQLGLVAQATLSQNQLALNDANTLAGRIREIQGTWRAAGKQVANLDPLKLVETRLVQVAATKPELASTKPPVNPSFVLTSRIQLPKLTPEQTGQTQAVAELPLKFIQFQPDSAVITEPSQRDIVEQIVPVLRRTPGLYLKVEGMAAKPPGVSDAEVEATARDRTNAVLSFLAAQGIDPNRLIGGTLKPEHPNSPNEEDLRQDRKVVFTLVTPGGR
jgi:NitT/TauT family transport system substrate-binding protein